MNPEAAGAEGGPAARADFVSALAWMVVGGAIGVGSWRMERLEQLHVNPYTVPGLVPGLLGAGILVMGAVLLARAVWAGGHRARHGPAAAGATEWRRLGLALVLCLAYAAGLLGRGLPFWLTSGAFVFVSVLLFDWPYRQARGEIGRGVLVALALAVGSAAAITGLFQEIFLVRLP
jgi:hypothetical protein